MDAKREIILELEEYTDLMGTIDSHENPDILFENDDIDEEVMIHVRRKE